jgi:hemoglobin
MRLSPGEEAGVTEPVIELVVHAFYDKVRSDPVLGPIFNGAIDDWDAHLARLCDFWSAVLLGGGRFKGTPMEAHVRVAERSPMPFGRWLNLFSQTVREHCPPAAAALFEARAQMIASSLRMAIDVAQGGPQRV